MPIILSRKTTVLPQSNPLILKCAFFFTHAESRKNPTCVWKESIHSVIFFYPHNKQWLNYRCKVWLALGVALPGGA